MSIFRLTDEICFPDPTLAEPDGLLAIGGDLSEERLLLAYSHGIFPWYNPGEEILWWCPKRRFLLEPGKVHISRSMAKFMRSKEIQVTLNGDFKRTMHECRILRENKEGTWITDEMEAAYNRLYESGYAVSVEAYYDGQLAGGLYGVSLGRCFFGESMFSLMKNGSKLALIALSDLLYPNDYKFIDCQFHTVHLESMGGHYVSWEEYDGLLAEGTGRTKKEQMKTDN